MICFSYWICGIYHDIFFIRPQTCAQYFRSNESVILETVSLAPSTDTVDLFGDHNNPMTTTNLGNHCTTSYGIIRSTTGIALPQHPNNNNSTSGSMHQHYSNTPTNLATKRRASDNPLVFLQNHNQLTKIIHVYKFHAIEKISGFWPFALQSRAKNLRAKFCTHILDAPNFHLENAYERK